MPLKDLALFTDYELKQELKITQDQPTHDYIVKLLQERAVEHLASQADVTQLGSDEINELLMWITDQEARDSLVKVSIQTIPAGLWSLALRDCRWVGSGHFGDGRHPCVSGEGVAYRGEGVSAVLGGGGGVAADRVPVAGCFLRA
jgi:hypothetical protein